MEFYRLPESPCFRIIFCVRMVFATDFLLSALFSQAEECVHTKKAGLSATFSRLTDVIPIALLSLLVFLVEEQSVE